MGGFFVLFPHLYFSSLVPFFCASFGNEAKRKILVTMKPK